jgi:hypothetical protein
MIPKVIYTTWVSEKPIPEKYNKYIESWRRVMPDYEIHVISLANIKRGSFVNKAIELKNYALAGHYARVQELYLNGGIYLDIDVEAINRFDNLVVNHRLILGAEDKYIINNAVMLAEKKQPFFKECMDYMDRTPFDTAKIELATGPIMFTNLMKKQGWSPGRYGTFRGVTILTPPHFYPYRYDQFFTPACITEKTFCVHHWANSWNNKVSIVIPCYNQAQFLPDSIGSALAQTHKDVEVIVVNDGSPDNTSAVVRKYGKKVKLVEQQNKGLSAARNAGIKASAGGWIITLDADDKLHPEYIEKTIGRSDIVSTMMQTFGAESKNWRTRLPGNNPTHADLLRENHINCAALFKKDVWTLAGGYDEDMKDGYEDWEFWIRATAAGFSIEIVNEPLFFYRKHRTPSMLAKARAKHPDIVAYMRRKHPNSNFKKQW